MDELTVLKMLLTIAEGNIEHSNLDELDMQRHINIRYILNNCITECESGKSLDDILEENPSWMKFVKSLPIG